MLDILSGLPGLVGLPERRGFSKTKMIVQIEVENFSIIRHFFTAQGEEKLQTSDGGVILHICLKQ